MRISTDTLRMATWNTLYEPIDSSARHAAIIQTLTESRSDVIALQEVWTSPQQCQAETIADSLGYNLLVSAPWRIGERWIGNALLSGLPIAASWSTPLARNGSGTERRTVLSAVLQTPITPIAVHTTHLSWDPAEENLRIAQGKSVNAAATRTSRQGLPTFICGDLNAEPGSAVVSAVLGHGDFTDAWELLHGTTGGHTWDLHNPRTHADTWPSRRIDYVVARDGEHGARVRPLAATLMGDNPVGRVWPSDHFGVLVDYSLDVAE